MSVCSDSEECCEHDVCDLCADERVEETCCTHCDECYDPHCSKSQYARGKFDPFCSDECREAHDEEDEEDDDTSVMTNVECTQCEQLFDPKCSCTEFDAVEQRWDMLYCSVKCYNKHNESEDKDHPEHMVDEEEKPKPKVGLRRLTAEEMAAKYPKEKEVMEKKDEQDEDKRECEKCECDISDDSGIEFFYCTSRGDYYCLDCAPEEEVCDDGGCDMCGPKLNWFKCQACSERKEDVDEDRVCGDCR
jgi:hypothetical protein